MSGADFQTIGVGMIQCVVCKDPSPSLYMYTSCQEAQNHAMSHTHQKNAGQTAGCSFIGPDRIQRIMKQGHQQYHAGGVSQQAELPYGNNYGSRSLFQGNDTTSLRCDDSQVSPNITGTSSTNTWSELMMMNFKPTGHKQEQYQKREQPTSKHPEAYYKQTDPRTNWIWCEVCENAVNGEVQYQIHVAGKKHKANQKQRGYRLVEEPRTPASMRPIGHGRPIAPIEKSTNYLNLTQKNARPHGSKVKKTVTHQAFPDDYDYHRVASVLHQRSRVALHQPIARC